jgi:hypothetical protein
VHVGGVPVGGCMGRGSRDGCHSSARSTTKQQHVQQQRQHVSSVAAAALKQAPWTPKQGRCECRILKQSSKQGVQQQ